MTIAQAIGRIDASAEQRSRAGEFLRLAQLQIRYAHDQRALWRSAEQIPLLVPRLREIIAKGGYQEVLQQRAAAKLQDQPEFRTRAAVTAGTTTSATNAAPLSQYEQVAEAFASSLVGSGSIFDIVRTSGAMPVPLHTRIVIVTTGTSGGATSYPELSSKASTDLSLGAGSLTLLKSLAQVIMSKELAEFSSPSAATIFNRELTLSVIRETDRIFLTQLLSTVTPTASSGTTAANFITDLGVLTGAVDVSATSNVYWVMSVSRALAYSRLLTTGGNLLLPNVGSKGGEAMSGVTILVSDSTPTNFSLMIVPDRLAIADDPIQLRGTTQSTIQMNTAPDSPETATTTPTSLWQADLVGLIAERLFSVTARARSVAALSH